MDVDFFAGITLGIILGVFCTIGMIGWIISDPQADIFNYKESYKESHKEYYITSDGVYVPKRLFLSKTYNMTNISELALDHLYTLGYFDGCERKGEALIGSSPLYEAYGHGYSLGAMYRCKCWRDW